MFLLTKVMAIELVWLGCLLVYLSAKQQVFFTKPLTKRLAWGGFSLAVLLSFLLFLQFYHPLAAIIFVLGVIMLAWIILALGSPYCPNIKLVLPAGSGLMLIPALLGAVHVN